MSSGIQVKIVGNEQIVKLNFFIKDFATVWDKFFVTFHDFISCSNIPVSHGYNLSTFTDPAVN